MMQETTRVNLLSIVCAISLVSTSYLLYRDYSVETRLSLLEAKFTEVAQRYQEVLTQRQDEEMGDLLTRRKRQTVESECTCPPGKNRQNYNRTVPRYNVKLLYYYFYLSIYVILTEN